MSKTYTWGSEPVLSFTVSDSITRASSGSASYSGYLTVSLGGCSGGSYFGYSITCTVNGETVTLKGNSPNTWSSGAYSHSFYISGSSTASSITIRVTMGTNAPRGGAYADYTTSIGTYDGGSSGGSSGGGSSGGGTTAGASIPTLSKSSVRLGESVVIYMNRQSSSYYHTVTYSVGGTSGTIATSVTTSCTWTPPTSLVSNVGSGATCTISVKTYRSSSVVIGTNTVRLTLYPPSDAMPSVSNGWITVARDNSEIPAVGAWVKGYSKAKITFDPSKVTAKYSATISKFSVEYGGESVDAVNNVATTKKLSDLNATIVCKVTDSRGVTTSESVEIPVLDYVFPTLTNVSAYRSDDAMLPADDGVHITAKATAGCSVLGGANSVTLTAAYKAVGAEAYGDEVTLTSGTAALVTGADDVSTMQSYSVRFTATDLLGNATTFEKTVPTKSVTFHLKSGGKGAAFGKYAETDELLECQWDAKFLGSLEVEEDATFQGKTLSEIIHEVVDPLLTGLLDIETVYPVGSIYMTLSELSPDTLFPGTTWQRLTGRFLLGSSDGLYSLGATGGEAMVTLTQSEMPSHTHTGSTSTDGYHSHDFPGRSASGSYGASAESFASSDNARTLSTDGGGYHTHTVSISSAGGGAAHNNMPPYLVVHMWKRMA